MDSVASRRHFLQLVSLGLTVRSGDTMGLIAPSGNASGKEEIQTAKENMEKYGLKVELGKHINTQKGYLAGTDDLLNKVYQCSNYSLSFTRKEEIFVLSYLCNTADSKWKMPSYSSGRR